MEANKHLSPSNSLKFKIMYATAKTEVELQRNVPTKDFIQGGSYKYYNYYILNLDMDLKLDVSALTGSVRYMMTYDYSDAFPTLDSHEGKIHKAGVTTITLKDFESDCKEDGMWEYGYCLVHVGVFCEESPIDCEVGIRVD